MKKVFLSDVKSCASKNLNTIALGVAAASSTIISTVNRGVASCKVTIGSGVENANMNGLMGGVAGTILDLLRWLGVFLLIWGVAHIYLSFKDDDANAKIKAMMQTGTAIGLITLKFILIQLGILAAA